MTKKLIARIKITQKIFIGCIALILIIYFVSFNLRTNALKLDNRSVRISSSIANAVVSNNFQFDIGSSAGIGSIKFEYCTNSALPDDSCVAPVGFDASSANLVYQQGETGFSIHANSTANKIIISRAPTLANPGTVRYNFGNITNPSASNGIVYIKIATYLSDDGTGARIDDGAVAFTTNDNVQVNLYVPPYLMFCVGITVNLNCQSTNGNFINLGELSSKNPSTSTSQMAAFTNDVSGYDIYVLGTTMTSGNNIINSLNPGASSIPGSSQFGINLKANNSPSIGSNPTGPGTGAPSPGYNIPNIFRYVNGDNIAGSLLSTKSTLFTVSYLINISQDQPPGYYSTTLTYTAVANF